MASIAEIGGLIGAIGGSIGALGGFAGAWFAYPTAKRRQEFDRELDRLAKEVQQKLHEEKLKLSEQLHNEEVRLAGRRFVMPLWEMFILCNRIDPNAPHPYDVQTAVNTLQLAAVCWEGEITDRDVMLRAFGENYVALFRQVEALKDKVPGLERNGPELLRENKPIEPVYRKICDRLDRLGTIINGSGL